MSQAEETKQTKHLEALSYHLENQIATIELNRPERHNSINGVMHNSLYTITDEIIRIAKSIRCLTIVGAGRSFCSGADLKEITTYTAEEAKNFMLKTTWAIRRFEKLPIPVIAGVKGYCMGGGLEMALHCDEIIAAQDTTFAFPETGIGIITTAGAISRLIMSVGLMRAKPLLIGKRFNAQEAFEMGLVSKVVANDQLETILKDRCQEIAKQPFESIATVKKIIQQHYLQSANHSWISEIEAFETLAQESWKNLAVQSLKK